MSVDASVEQDRCEPSAETVCNEPASTAPVAASPVRVAAEPVKTDPAGAGPVTESVELPSAAPSSSRSSFDQKKVMGNFVPGGRQSGDEREFPTTLAGFGYEFNDNGELRDKKTGGGFVFVVKDGDKEFNQRHYEALGEVITTHVYNLLEKEAGLERVNVPVDAERGEATSFVFQSPDFLQNKEKLLLLIHGSGVVRAGQWARRLIINDCLRTGTQLPFISRAVRNGYAVLVLNTNLNTYQSAEGGLEEKIRENGSPEEHAIYVWKTLVTQSPAKQVDIIAHSYGGCVTVDLMRKCLDARRRVHHIAFTDSVHSLPARKGVDDDLVAWFEERAVNWVSSKKPVDTPLMKHNRDTERRSAGVDTHELTSWSAFQSIFKFLAADLPVFAEEESQATSGACEEVPVKEVTKKLEELAPDEV